MRGLCSSMSAVLLLLLINFAYSASSTLIFTADKPMHYYRWDVEYMYHSPHCREGIVMGINRQFPGPTIRAHAGDTLHIELTNKLYTEGVVIHWHGIRQLGTPWADGTASISQCAINAGETFVYIFKVDKPGTYFYHGHLGMQRSAGLYGSLIVDVAEGHKEPFHYDGEINLPLSDWWHKTTHEQENHKLVVVEADGNYVTPFAVDDMDIYSGESYSVLLKTGQGPSSNYWVSFNVRGREPQTPPALTVLHYGPGAEHRLPATPPPKPPLWNNYTHSKIFSNKITALTGSEKPPTTHDRRIVLLNTQNLINGYTKWAINNISLRLPSTPYLGSIKHGLGSTAFDQTVPPDNYPIDYDIKKPPPNSNTTISSGVYTIELNKTIDVVLQNANILEEGRSEIHPWHLHGHDFWILGYGEGEFKDSDEKTFNLKDPPLRNMAVLYPYGWTALRFVTDNPGVWAFHCHIEPHLHMGMGVIFVEGVHQVENIPESAMACGLTAKMSMTGTGYYVPYI